MENRHMKKNMPECIFGYICQNNYMGKCTPADQIYTLTEGMEPSLLSILSRRRSDVGRMELSKIDAVDGIVMPDSRVGECAPSSEFYAYAYLPGGEEEYAVFTSSSLRKSVMGKGLRGSKELTHALAFKGVDKDFYVVDMIDDKHFSAWRDIPLDESGEIRISNEDVVCEEKPKLLPPIGWENFSSRALRGADVSSLGGDAFEKVSEFVHALMISMSQGRTLYVVYDPADYAEIIAYLKIVLKLFPSEVANEISFITAHGKPDGKVVNICGVPTVDQRYVELLKTRGNVISVTGFEQCYLGGEKGSFAALLATVNAEQFGYWLEEFKRYGKAVHTPQDMDAVASLYLNAVRQAFDSSNLMQSLHNISACIRAIGDRFDMILGIEDELESQLKGVGYQLQLLCGGFTEYKAYDIEKALVEPILALYNVCKKHSREAAAETVLLWLQRVLFGDSDSEDDLKNKLYEVYSSCHEGIVKALGEHYGAFIASVERKWNGLRPFFDGYLNALGYEEIAARISLSYLKYFLQDLATTQYSRIEIRNYFVTNYLQKNLKNFVQITELILANGGRLQDQLTCIFDTVFELNRDDESLIKDRIEEFCRMISERGLLERVLDFVRARYIRAYSSRNEILETIFKKLLDAYLAVSQRATLFDLYASLQKAKEIVGDNSGASLSRLVYEVYVNNVLTPAYSEAAARIRDEDISEAQKAQLNKFSDELESLPLSVAPQDIIKKLKQLLERLEGYMIQKSRENELVESRINFIVKELLLLKNGTICSLLCKYVGYEDVKAAFKAKNINGIQKHHPKFLMVAEEVAYAYLRNKDAMKKMEFCEKIQKERRRNHKPIVNIIYFFGNMVRASIFTVVVFIVALIVGNIVCVSFSGGYFQNGYSILAAVVAAVSFCIYWMNYDDRLMKNIVFRSSWQVALLLVVTLGIFTLAQYLMALLTL